jgi:hypothetical protein
MRSGKTGASDQPDEPNLFYSLIDFGSSLQSAYHDETITDR